MFSGARRCDEALGQARQRALHNARHFAQRAAQHVAMVAHAGAAKQERWPAQWKDGRKHLLHICATRMQPGSQRKMGHAATKAIAAKNACMHAKDYTATLSAGAAQVGKTESFGAASNSMPLLCLELGTALLEIGRDSAVPSSCVYALNECAM